jgi:hypothetical protein
MAYNLDRPAPILSAINVDVKIHLFPEYGRPGRNG